MTEPTGAGNPSDSRPVQRTACDRWNFNVRKMVSLLLLLMLAVLVIRFRMSERQGAVAMMKEIIPEATGFDQLSGSLYKVHIQSKVSGYLTVKNATGYGGTISVMALYDPEGTLKDVRVISHSETPSFFQYVMNKGFLDQFRGKPAGAPFNLDEDINAVSSATYTSRGIDVAVRKGAHELAQQELDLSVAGDPTRSLSIEECTFLALIALTMLFNKRRWTWGRPYILGASFLLLGLWQKSVFNLSNIAVIVSGNIPAWNEMPFWVLPMVGVSALLFFTRRNLYCHWLCPYGCVMQLVSKLGQFAGFNSNPSVKNHPGIINDLRLLLAWAALALGFFLKNPGISTFEPFGTLFSFKGGGPQWILMAFTLVTALILYRFWCRFLCPTGAIFDLVADTRGNLKKRTGMLDKIWSKLGGKKELHRA